MSGNGSKPRCACGEQLPHHLAGIGLTEHVCLCERRYKVVNGRFIENGTALNPGARYDQAVKSGEIDPSVLLLPQGSKRKPN